MLMLARARGRAGRTRRACELRASWLNRRAYCTAPPPLSLPFLPFEYMVYELIYHPGFTGRLEPILTLLSDAGIEYEISSETFSPQARSLTFSVWAAADTWLDLAGDVESAVEDGIGAPPFFCPILRDGEFTLAQTPAIMEFLGRKHGCKWLTTECALE
eukprot:COSAG02_NODE_8_length_60691_cov_104.994752_17_plen_159_part_00